MVTRLIAAFCLGIVVTLGALWQYASFATALDQVAETIAPLAAAGACIWTARDAEGRHHWAWLLIGLSALAWGLGQGAWVIQGLVLHQDLRTLYPSWPDLRFLTALPLGIAGVMLFWSVPGSIGERLRTALDACLIGTSLLFISWVMASGHAYAQTGGGLLQRSIALAYPIGDAGLLTVVIVGYSRFRAGRHLAYVLLGAGVLCNGLAGSMYAHLTTIGSSDLSSPADIGWMAGYVLIGLAAVRAGRQRAIADGDESDSPLWGTAMPSVLMVAAGAVAITKQFLDHSLDQVAVWEGLLIIAMAITRQFVMLTDNSALTRDLAERVDERTAELFEGRAHLHASETRFRSLVQNSSDVITILDRAYRVDYVSASVTRVLGYPADDLAGVPIGSLFHPEDTARFQAVLAGAPAAPDHTFAFEGRMRSRDGSWRFTETRVTSLVGNPSVGGIVLNTRDITERKHLEQQLVHQAFHDALTGLPNRVLLRDRLEHEISRQSRRNKKSLGVLIVDIDGFKAVNDTRGQAFGDELLRLVAARLLGVLRPGDTVARLGGDEFGVLLEDLKDDAEAARVAQRVLDSFGGPFSLEGRELMVDASVGIAVPLSGAERADDLLGYADLAMYKAKERGTGNYAFFQPELQSAVVDRLDLETSMKAALDRDEFVLHYQPVVALATGRVIGFEALIRWIHPDRGVIPPLDFIPIAEQTGLIVDIGRWVMQTACRQANIWRTTLIGCADLTMAVNLSVRQLRDPNLLADVTRSLVDASLDASALTLEVTESLLMDDVDGAIVRLGAIRDLGVRIALDDFGTGYSSFSYLRQIPLDTIKIDRSFVMAFDSDPGSTALARSIVDLGGTLGLSIVAEGIEEPQQLAQLIALGCSDGQGYYFSKPVPADAIPEVMGRINHSMVGQIA